jgi:hypothetical protein
MFDQSTMQCKSLGIYANFLFTSQSNLQERCKLCSCCPQATDLPDGTVVGDVSSLKDIPNASWSTFLLNEMHMQIKVILKESGFLELQRHGFNWMLH